LTIGAAGAVGGDNISAVPVIHLDAATSACGSKFGAEFKHDFAIMVNQ
jgi:hypothetical protein